MAHHFSLWTKFDHWGDEPSVFHIVQKANRRFLGSDGLAKVERISWPQLVSRCHLGTSIRHKFPLLSAPESVNLYFIRLAQSALACLIE